MINLDERRHLKDLPVCVLICLFNKLGRSNAFPHTSHGSMALSPRVGLALGDDFGMLIVVSIISPVLLPPDECNESPDTDFSSSSPLETGEIGKRTRDRRERDKSKGESKGKNWLKFVKESEILKIYLQELNPWFVDKEYFAFV